MPISLEQLKKIEEKSKSQNREVRFGNWFQKRDDEQNDESDPYYHIEGKAVSFNDTYIMYDDPTLRIEETIDENAFDEADMSDVVLNANHGNGNYAVARTRNGTLALEIKKGDGVYSKGKLRKDNPRTSQYYKDVSEGLLDRMSFAFTIKAQERSEEEKDGKLFVYYRITKVDKVYDVSAVEFPAYKDTSISASRAKDLVESFENLVKLEKEKSNREKLIAKIEMIQKIQK